MGEIWVKRLSNLLCVKSIVTLILSVAFAYLAIVGKVSSQDFLPGTGTALRTHMDTSAHGKRRMPFEQLKKHKTEGGDPCPLGHFPRTGLGRRSL